MCLFYSPRLLKIIPVAIEPRKGHTVSKIYINATVAHRCKSLLLMIAEKS